MRFRHYSMNEALADPGRIFGSPQNVLSDPRLDRGAKLEILRKWRHDAKALSVAEYEGMEGDGPSLLRRVQQAIDHLAGNNEN